jgi:hypothetical protein
MSLKSKHFVFAITFFLNLNPSFSMADDFNYSSELNIYDVVSSSIVSDPSTGVLATFDIVGDVVVKNIQTNATIFSERGTKARLTVQNSGWMSLAVFRFSPVFGTVSLAKGVTPS